MTDTPSTGWTERLFGGFRRTSERLTENLGGLFTGGKLDADTLDRIEEALIVSDLGPDMAARIRGKLAEGRVADTADESAVRALIADEIEATLKNVAKPLEIVAFPRPQVILVVGVNGSGKTTTIGKLAHLFMEQDYSVMLAAGEIGRAHV